MRSLRMKMVMIMVILILALMLTTGAFLMSGVGNFYVSEFYEQMETTFTRNLSCSCRSSPRRTTRPRR